MPIMKICRAVLRSITHLNTVKASNNNAKYRFYFTLLHFLKSGVFDSGTARNLVQISNDEPDVTLPDVTVENLSDWCERRREDEIFKTMTRHCFADLAVQMRWPIVNDLFTSWKYFSGMNFDLFIHLRRKRLLSGKNMSTNLIASNEALFWRFSHDPKAFFAQGDTVHFSDDNGGINVPAT